MELGHFFFIERNNNVPSEKTIPNLEMYEKIMKKWKTIPPSQTRLIAGVLIENCSRRKMFRDYKKTVPITQEKYPA